MPRVLSTLVSTSLRAVAEAFIDLQELRHLADYDLGVPRFTKQRTLVAVQRAEHAFVAFQAAQADPLLPLYLVLLLTGESILRVR